jgi:proline dehydrogenase
MTLGRFASGSALYAARVPVIVQRSKIPKPHVVKQAVPVSSTQQTTNPNSQYKPLNFDDAKSAFQSRTTFEIARALVVFQLCGVKPLVANAAKLLEVSNKVLGESFTSYVIGKTFFAHFVAGQDAVDIKPTIKRLEAGGIHSILDFAAEKDKKPDEVQKSGILSARAYNEQIEEKECDDNVEIFLECIRAAAQFEDGFAAIKVTGLGRPALLEALANVVHTVRKTFLDLDTAGTNALDFNNFHLGIKKLGIQISEAEAKDLFVRFDHDEDGVIDILEWTEYLKVEDL